jgi:hypothetical protein
LAIAIGTENKIHIPTNPIRAIAKPMDMPLASRTKRKRKPIRPIMTGLI